MLDTGTIGDRAVVGEIGSAATSTIPGKEALAVALESETGFFEGGTVTVHVDELVEEGEGGAVLNDGDAASCEAK